MTNTIIESSQNDLNILLEQILAQGRPSHQNLDQLENDLEELNIELNKTKDKDIAHNISNLIHLIESIIKKYRQTTGSIRITRENKEQLRDLGATYDLAITKLLDFYDKNR